MAIVTIQAAMWTIVAVEMRVTAGCFQMNGLEGATFGPSRATVLQSLTQSCIRASAIRCCLHRFLFMQRK